MAFNKPDSADTTDFSGKSYGDSAAAQAGQSSYTVTPADSTSELSYINTDFSKYMGAYNEIPELAAMIDRKGNYVVGKGFKADKKTMGILNKIRGNGLDSFNIIMYNCVRTYTAGGDSFCEIIKDQKGKLRNLKPLNPGTIKVIANKGGVVTGYQQKQDNRQPDEEATIDFKPDEIFHLPYNRIADQIHGQSVIKKLMQVIEFRKEAMNDMRIVFHRYVKPLIISAVDTDDETEITNYKAKLDTAMSKGENMVVPKGVLADIEKISIPQFSTLDPLPWIQLLQTEFLKAEGVPDVVLGAGVKGTEAESKILYLAWQQVVEFNQMFLEEQIKAQLGLKVEFEFPASIEPDLTKDEKKDPTEKVKPVEAGKDQR
jgi:hypothetical protein